MEVTAEEGQTYVDKIARERQTWTVIERRQKGQAKK